MEKFIGPALWLYLLFLIGLIILFVIVWLRIFRKAGFGSWTGLLMFLPIVNIIMLLILAFKEWPIEKRVREIEGGRSN